MNSLRIQSLTQTIMSQMASIEANQGKMFSEIDPMLEAAIFEAIDSKNVANINHIIAVLDDLT